MDNNLNIVLLGGGNWNTTEVLPVSYLEVPATVTVLHRLSADGKLVPHKGMGCTEQLFTDRRAYTVVAVSASGKTCKVQADKFVRTDANGMSEDQTYDYAPDPNGAVVTLRLTKKGWRSGGRRFGMGYRRAYHDFSF